MCTDSGLFFENNYPHCEEDWNCTVDLCYYDIRVI